MQITLLGTGAAFPDPDRAQSGILVTLAGGRHFLFDCGAGTVRHMVEAGVSPAEVEAVFLTHLHHDHICDFPLFAITGWMWDRDNAPRVFGPPGTASFCGALFEGGAFDADFRARSAYPRRQENLVAVRPDVREVEPGVALEDGEVRITCDLVDHIPPEISQCYGIRFEAEGRTLAFSGDTAPCASMIRLARDADLLIHECTFPESFIEHRRKTGVGIVSHTSPTELGRIARDAEVKRLVPTHFGHFESTNAVIRRCSTKHFPVELMGPHLMEEVERDIRRHYGGPLTMAHDLLRIEL